MTPTPSDPVKGMPSLKLTEGGKMGEDGRIRWFWICWVVDVCLLVGGLEPWNFMTFHNYIGKNNPNWLIFFRGVETTNQFMLFWQTFPMEHPTEMGKPGSWWGEDGNGTKKTKKPWNKCAFLGGVSQTKGFRRLWSPRTDWTDSGIGVIESTPGKKKEPPGFTSKQMQTWGLMIYIDLWSSS